MSVATDLLHPNIKKTFLAEITCGEHLRTWTLDTGTTYYATAIYNVVDVKEDGTSLTSRASIALVNSNAGSYYFDSANNRVYVHTTASADVHTVTIQAINQFFYSNRGIILNSQYYEPRLASAPNLSLRIETDFTGIPQISGGNLSFTNADGFFDEYSNLQWDAGTVVLKLGTTLNKNDTAYANYEIVGTWLIQDWRMNKTAFSLTVKEYKVKIKKKIPYTFYGRDVYPNIEQEDIGKPIQIAYGIIVDAKPALIDIAARKFKVAGHAIHEYQEVRVRSQATGYWSPKTYETKDKTNAEFTLSANDWVYGDEVAVDFKGKERAANVVMDNASDVIKDILETYLGESASVNATSFSDAYTDLHAGSIYHSDDLKTYRAVGHYINEVKPAYDHMEQINKIGSYLYANTTGEFFYKVFLPEPSEGLTEFTDKEIWGFTESIDNRNLISKAKVTYKSRLIGEWSQFKTYELTESQHLHNEKVVKIKEINSPLYDSDDAQALAERTVIYEGQPQRQYSFNVAGRKALLLSPSNFIRVVFPRHNIDGVYEILQLDHNLLGNTAHFVVGDSHGLGEKPGFWVNDADVLPVRYGNDTGYNGGSLDWDIASSDRIKKWKLENVGYWTDANGYIDATDPDSFLGSNWI